jgi:hypothetical protein
MWYSGLNSWIKSYRVRASDEVESGCPDWRRLECGEMRQVGDGMAVCGCKEEKKKKRKGEQERAGSELGDEKRETRGERITRGCRTTTSSSSASQLPSFSQLPLVKKNQRPLPKVL